MGHSVGDGLIVAALAAVAVAYLYFRHVGRQRRLEIVHQERLAAMENGIPVPGLPHAGAAFFRPAKPGFRSKGSASRRHLCVDTRKDGALERLQVRQQRSYLRLQ